MFDILQQWDSWCRRNEIAENKPQWMNWETYHTQLANGNGASLGSEGELCRLCVALHPCGPSALGG